MRSFWLNFLAVLITFISVHATGLQDFSQNLPQDSETISSVDRWTQTFLNGASKNNSGQIFLAQDFMPIVTIAISTIDSLIFDFYLSVYRYTREKIYFLLI